MNADINRDISFTPLESMYIYKQYIPTLVRTGGLYNNPINGSLRCLSIFPATGAWYDNDLGIGGDVIDFVAWANDLGIAHAISYISSIIDGLDGTDMLIRRNEKLDYSKRSTVIKGNSMSIEQLNLATEELLSNKEIMDSFAKINVYEDSLIRNNIGLIKRRNLDFIVYPSSIINGKCRHYRAEGYGKDNNAIVRCGIPSNFIKPNPSDNKFVLCLDRITTLMLDSIGVRACLVNENNYRDFYGKDVIIFENSEHIKYSRKIAHLLSLSAKSVKAYEMWKYSPRTMFNYGNLLAMRYYACVDKQVIIDALREELYVKDDR